MSDKIKGFLPIFDAASEVLILGSFPSVKSRKTDFYYGNNRNRFWGMIFGYFGETLQEDISYKIDFLFRHRIALWDIVTECEIIGSSDATIKNYLVADVPALLEKSSVRLILLNGAAAYKILIENYGGLGVPFLRMPSTSPANPRYSPAAWYAALDTVFIE